jgi:hypothetical protein
MTSMKEKIELRAFLETTAPVQYSKFITRREVLQKQYGIKQENGLDNVLVFEHIMDEIKEEKFDFVCIDSLNALLGNPNKITRKVLERIIDKVTEINATLLIVHHINKKGEVSGTSDLGNTVDSVYILSESKDDKNVLVLEETKARHKPKGEETMLIRKEDAGDFLARFKEAGDAQKSIQKQNEWFEKLSPTEKTIAEAFRDNGTIEMDKEALEEYLNERGVGPSSLANILLKLEKKGIVKGVQDKGKNK